MKQYSYYDAYHRQKKFPMMFRLYRLRGKRGVFLLSFLLQLSLCVEFCGKKSLKLQDGADCV